MKKLNTSPISGMQELLPLDQSVFNKFKREIEGVFHSHGFLEIETPTIDRSEILFAKAGGDTEKQIYKVVKTEETASDADQALRFDHTVPLARYVAEHESNLAFPFRVTQIGRNFRGERAQKGRFREFYQADIDVIGRNDLPLEYDAEIIVTLFNALGKLNLPEKLVRISNRKILSGLLEEYNLDHLSKEIFNIIDHAEKVPAPVTKEKFLNLGIGEENVEKLLGFIEISGKLEEVRPKFKELNVENEKFRTGVEELLYVLSLLEKQGLSGSATADMKIIRGLDYYTGTVFETILPAYKEIGSVCSGGRYENLAELYTDQKFPGVGGSIGLTRLFFVLNEYGLISEEKENPVDLALIPFSKDEFEFVFSLAEKFRAEGKTVDIVFSGKKLGDKLKYASKVARFGIVIGEDEVKTGNYRIKNFETGEQVSA
ncbi:histidine--tRNA ligase [Candidatus Saccharibacteria bacterium]|nr:histidine--tRNA ligase [Candidatus Saccharibacteria bacterium]